MLLSLSVRNFKSIARAQVRFGPLTCLIGRNGAGKSNLFDAIRFLSGLAGRSVPEASADDRRHGSGASSPLDLIFGRDPNRGISLAADMIVTPEATDDFGEPARPSTTLLTYRVELGCESDSGRLLVESEGLTHARLGDFRKFAVFPSSAEFRKSVALGARRGVPLISTGRDGIRLHGDGGSRGRVAAVGRSPLTVVAGTNTADYPTVLAAKREMASWRSLHLEPSALRAPDAGSARSQTSRTGAGMPSALRALVDRDDKAGQEIVSRLRGLGSDIRDVGVWFDSARARLALRARIAGADGWLHAPALSDGALRQIALVMALLDREPALLCIEEPENGVYPAGMPALADLLRGYAVDLNQPVSCDNPLRQVVLNSHSPALAKQCAEENVIVVERARVADAEATTVFRPVEGTWRAAVPGPAGQRPPPADDQAFADFAAGSPVCLEGDQLSLDLEAGPPSGRPVEDVEE